MAVRQERTGLVHSGESPGVRVPPPAFFMVGAGLGLALKHRWPWRILPVEEAGGIELAGWLLALAGTLFCLWAAALFHRARTALMPTRGASRFVQEGPFRISRNPMYVGMACAYVGAALVLDTWWLLVLLPPVLLVIDRYVIAREERYLQRRFGAEYSAYCGQVRRWL